MPKKSIAVFLVFSALYACALWFSEYRMFSAYYAVRSDAASVEKEIGEAVVLYNEIFSDIFASDGSPQTLNDFPAATWLKHEVYKEIGFLRTNGMVFVYDNADIVIKEVIVGSPFRAEALVYEEWNYLPQEITTRSPLDRIKGMDAEFRYLLSKTDKGWIVTDYFPEDISGGKRE